MFWQEEKKFVFFHECHAIFDFLGKWLLNVIDAITFILDTFLNLLCVWKYVDVT